MIFFKQRKKEYNKNQQMQKIAAAGCFDVNWYKKQYPDVLAAGVDPLRHYFYNGWKEGRNPSADFDNNAYLKKYPELLVLDINPLAQYLAKKTKLIIKYDTIFSLGEVCFCANYLRALRLRKFSAPFDWVAGAAFKERMDFLLDGFQNFFNAEDLIYHGKREFPQPCDIYYNQRTHIMFNHDFPLYKSFAEQYPKVKSRYDRRIKKLYENLNKANKALIVYMEQADTHSEIKSDNELCFLMKKLNDKFPDTHIDLIYIRHNENMQDDEYTIKRVDAYVITAQCFNRSRELDTTAVGNLHNVKKVLEHIGCKDNIFSVAKYYVYLMGHNLGKIIYQHKIKQDREYIKILGVKIYIKNHSEDAK